MGIPSRIAGSAGNRNKPSPLCAGWLPGYATRSPAAGSQDVPRKKSRINGVELVAVERDTVHNSYTTSFGARVVGKRVQSDYGYADDYTLTDEFLKSKAVLTSTAMGNALKAVIDRLRRADGLRRPGIDHTSPRIACGSGSRWPAAIDGAIDAGNQRSRAIGWRSDANTAKAVQAGAGGGSHGRGETAGLDGTLNEGHLDDAAGAHVRAERAQALLDKIEVHPAILSDGRRGWRTWRSYAGRGRRRP